LRQPLPEWSRHRRIRPAITDEHGDNPEVDTVAKANARLQAESLVSSSDVIAQAAASGGNEDGVRIVTAFYDIESGEVSFT
jgi:carbonic anhydrase